ncbi:dihydrofolate reductase family protein [Longispora urticae]
MRKLVYLVHSSLDGHIEAPDGVFDWPVMGPELSAYSNELTARADAFLYGRLVWEMMSSYWPNAESISDHPHDLKFAPVWRRTPKFVFSRTLDKADWNTTVLSGDLAAEVAALKAGPGKDLLLTGGSQLASALTREGLIDEYQVVVQPVVLGGGKKLFPEPQDRLRLALIDTRTFDGDTVLLRYRRA